ncbi:MAG TPA: ABC transporter permease [Candidatus Limnocylindrales bacterium]|nr:ABC transporter permease [Candidatus Limnocylindrales bacterium]
MLARLRSLWHFLRHRSQFESDLDDEMRFHVETRADDLVRSGVPRTEALRLARIEFGCAEAYQDRVRESRRIGWFDGFSQDLRFALRMLRKSPGFTAAAILTLALGIGPNTAIFTVIDAVLLRALPYPNPEQLITWRTNESELDIDDIRAQASFFSSGGGVNPEVLTYSGGSEPLGVHTGYVDAGLFQALGVSPMLGRVLSTDDDRFGGPRVVVVSHRFWREYLDGDPAVLGKTIPLDGNSYTVIGVMPANFAVPQYDLDLFVSLRVAYPDAARYRGVHLMQTVWRLKPGVTLAQTTAGMAPIEARLARDYPGEEKDHHRIPVPLQQAVTGNVRPALLVLSGAVGLVLLIACANFAGLLMARTAVRRREMIIRAALGGARHRLVRQALTESTLLAVLGGAVALPLALLCVRVLVAAKPAALAHLNEISMNPEVIAFGVVVSLLTGLIFGLAPAWNVSRADVTGMLKQEGRTATAGPAGNAFRTILVIAEIGLALILLAGTGLLVRSFARVRSVNPGFDPAHLIAINVQLPNVRYAEISQQLQFRRALLDNLNAIPQVQAAMVGDVPLSGSEVTHSLAIDGRPPVAEGDEPDVDTFCVMGDYFGVMRIPLRAGRDLTPMDREDQPLVAVINEALARQFFVGQNPIGQRIRWAREKTPRWMTIVGVVADVKQYSLAEPAFPAVFTPFAQTNEAWRRWMSVVVRAPGSFASVVPGVKRAIWSLDSQIPLNRIQSMDELLGLSLAERQFNMSLLGLFAALAMVLVAVGIYGVISYGVSQRTHEIGIRLAVGASRVDVLALVLGQGARMAAFGIFIGILGAFALTRLMTKLLFGVTATDPVTFAGVVALMVVVVFLASLIPARRAMRVDPMVALRHD